MKNLNDKMTVKEALELVKVKLEDLRNNLRNRPKSNVWRWNERGKKYEKEWMKQLQSYIHIESYLYRSSLNSVENLEKVACFLSQMDDEDKHEKSCVEFVMFVVKHQEAISSKILVLEKNTLNLLWKVWKQFHNLAPLPYSCRSDSGKEGKGM